MTQADAFATPPPPAAADPRRPANLLNVWLLMAFAVLLGVAVQWDYILARYCESVDADRVDALAGGIVAALGAAACLGGAMHFLDRKLDAGVSWPGRWLLILQKRVLMIVQMAAAGIAVYAASLMVSHNPVPNPLPPASSDTPVALYSELPVN